MQDKMTEKEYVPFGVEVYVSNLEASLEFYKKLGFNVIRNDSGHNFVSFEFNSAIFMIEQRLELVEPTKGIVMRFVVPDVKGYYEEIVSRGIEVYKPLETKDYGATRFYLKDPDGYQIKFLGK